MYTVIKNENYETEIGTANTLEEAAQLIESFNAACKYPLDIQIETEEDGVDAFGARGTRFVTFYTIKKG